jgi:hypothetical protein
MHARPKVFASPNPARRGHTLIEVLMALLMMTVIFVFITGDMMAISHQDKATDQTVEIAGANYYLGIVKSDPGFWLPDWGTGPQDACGDQLPPYTDAYPSPPAQPQWHDFLFCEHAPAFVDPNSSSPAPITMQYMWNVAQRPDVNAADLTVWIRKDGSSPVYEYHALRYHVPQVIPPSPYSTGASPSPSPEESASPPGSPTPGPSPTPTRPPTPTPSPTGWGV